MKKLTIVAYLIASVLFSLSLIQESIYTISLLFILAGIVLIVAMAIDPTFDVKRELIK